eukprot:166881-Prymnesium_polylepis.1
MWHDLECSAHKLSSWHQASSIRPPQQHEIVLPYAVRGDNESAPLPAQRVHGLRRRTAARP